jgi:ABC-type Fe3+/spermidine/putrescine transport system ATPase subunit
MIQGKPALELRNLVRSFADGRVKAVDGVSLEVAAGEIVSILGPSGCGKTTIMRMIAGLDHPTGGQIRIHGADVTGRPPHQRNIGLVFQSLAVFPHMSVAQNVAFGLRMRGVQSDVADRKVREVLKLVQLPFGKFGERRPTELSGGQLQRVALARTLVTEPALVLFDEPMAALDRRLRDYMAVELRAIQKQLGIAAVYVTHDQETASTMSDRIALMEAGKLVQVGPPAEVYEAPLSRFAAEFLGDANVLKAERVLARRADIFDVQVNGYRRMQVAARSDATDGMLAIFRPSQTRVHLADPGAMALEGKLISTQFNSGLYRWHVGLGGDIVVSAQSSDNHLQGAAIDQPVWVTVDPARTRLVAA